MTHWGLQLSRLTRLNTINLNDNTFLAKSQNWYRNVWLMSQWLIFGIFFLLKLFPPLWFTPSWFQNSWCIFQTSQKLWSINKLSCSMQHWAALHLPEPWANIVTLHTTGGFNLVLGKEIHTATKIQAYVPVSTGDTHVQFPRLLRFHKRLGLRILKRKSSYCYRPGALPVMGNWTETVVSCCDKINLSWFTCVFPLYSSISTLVMLTVV